MIKRNIKYKKTSQIKNAIFTHIENNIKEYFTLLIAFFIGIILGVLFINNFSDNQVSEINEYVTSFISSLKNNNNVDELLLLKDSILKNISFITLLWFVGCTIIGMPIIYLIIVFRGFCFGYAISSIIAILGTGKGLIFLFTTLFLQNMILIPAMFVSASSGIRLYNAIINNREKRNIKLQILKHTTCNIALILVMVVCSLIEVYISKNLLILCINYI